MPNLRPVNLKISISHGIKGLSWKQFAYLSDDRNNVAENRRNRLHFMHDKVAKQCPLSLPAGV
jgi:hypothetical protein